MNREEIENRIIVCEYRAKGFREVGNTKTADRYDNERHKWEKLLGDLDLLNERKIMELLEYKKGYFNLQNQNEFLTKRENKLQTIEQMYKSGSVDLDKLRKIVMEEK